MQNTLLTQKEQESVNASRELLQNAFEVPLRAWMFDGDWHELIQNSVGELSENGSVEQPQIEGLPLPSLTTPEPFLLSISGGRQLIGIPVVTTLHAVVYAVGESSSGAETLLKAVSLQSRQILASHEERQQDLVRMDSFSDQILHDFEERNWLIQLTDHLEMCELDRDFGDVVQSLLPRLKTIINAETVAFVPECAVANLKTQARKTLVCSTGSLENVNLKEVVLRFRRAATFQTTIKTWNTCLSDPERIAGIDTLMIIGVTRDSHLIGWLIAINRSAESGLTVRVTAEADENGFTDFGFGTAEASLLRSAASVLATHHHNLKLFHANQNLTVSVVRSLANAVDARDAYTHGHSDRVARMARHLGRRSGQPSQHCEQLLMTGQLHDIGKIGVPDRVLLKPGPLDDEEFALIKRHPVTGYQILQHIAELSYTLDGVLYHHEAWDGSGYPEGLKGEAIPLFARILAVVDAYDAMTSNRPYRDGSRFEHAESILSNGSGKHWDPALIEVFLKYKDEFRCICRESHDHSQSLNQVDMKALAHMPEESKLEFVLQNVVPEFAF